MYEVLIFYTSQNLVNHWFLASCKVRMVYLKNQP